MNVKDAIILMAKNPAVDFPWEQSVIDLVNSLIPEGSALTPNATAERLIEVIDSLDASTREMIYSSKLTNLGELPKRESSNSKADDHRQLLTFSVFGVTVCICAIILTLKVGETVDATHVVEVVKLLVSLLNTSANGE